MAEYTSHSARHIRARRGLERPRRVGGFAPVARRECIDERLNEAVSASLQQRPRRAIRDKVSGVQRRLIHRVKERARHGRVGTVEERGCTARSANLLLAEWNSLA